MTDSRPPAADADAELLSAYLAGELADADVDVLEHRLAAEPALAAQLDALAEALVTLRGADAADPPDGFNDRLRQRLDAEAAAPADAATATDPDVISLDVARAQRRVPPRWWAAVGTAAAVGVAGAVMFSGALGGLSGGGGSEMAGSAAQDSAAQESAENSTEGAEQRTAADADADEESDAGGDAGGGGGGAGTPESGSAPAPDEAPAAMAAPPTEPLINDANARLRNERAVLRRYRPSFEVQGLLGTPLSEAEELSASFGDAVRAAPAFADGTRPDACLDAITAGATAPVVPVAVETVRYDGQSSLAYVFVTATPQAEQLDRFEAWVVNPADCATLVFVQR